MHRAEIRLSCAGNAGRLPIPAALYQASQQPRCSLWFAYCGIHRRRYLSPTRRLDRGYFVAGVWGVVVEGAFWVVDGAVDLVVVPLDVVPVAVVPVVVVPVVLLVS